MKEGVERKNKNEPKKYTYPDDDKQEKHQTKVKNVSVNLECKTKTQCQQNLTRHQNNKRNLGLRNERWKRIMDLLKEKRNHDSSSQLSTQIISPSLAV